MRYIQQSQMEVMLGIDFFFNDLALNSMASSFNEAYSLSPVDLVSKEYQLSLNILFLI